MILILLLYYWSVYHFNSNVNLLEIPFLNRWLMLNIYSMESKKKKKKTFICSYAPV